MFLRSGLSPGISVSTWVEEKTKEERRLLLKKKKKRSDCVTAFYNDNKIPSFVAKKKRRHRLFGLVLHSSSNMVTIFLYSLFFISPETSTCRGSSASLLHVLYSGAWFGFRNRFRFRVVDE